MEKVDAVVVGAGVIGLAIAARLSKNLANVVIIDKHKSFGEETSSRNSEVIHAGIYYPQDSLKAKLCVEGKQALYRYCDLRGVPYKPIGKLIVATTHDQQSSFEAVITRAEANGVTDLIRQSSRQLHTFSSELKATAGLLSPSTGIIDSHSYMQSLLAEIEANGGSFVPKTGFVAAEPDDKGFVIHLDIEGEPLKIRTRYLINSAGLYSTQVASSIQGVENSLIPQLHWCKGHYFSYSGKSPFSKLVYPVPEIALKGLGIHGTLDMSGQLKFGPDTQYISDNTEPDHHVSPALKPKFVEAIRRYFPNIDPDKLQPSYSGIRPKLQGPNANFEDFKIESCASHSIKGLINLYGIESPGLTASLAIADYVAASLEGKS
ncbi:NAD(P)/FAD-dependent oxidoreductase [Shewanella eurypsychrophilus]|uniref:NAD(P)/FAD-dependent oxidoreductase n=1 Tax=Shewanella eurypsychrophilus TaxID=2593656 RepID=A0ABX6V1Q2_9GAMM|nr:MULTISPECIES: NAD(P)/FAD-dependent oxidoreductase [Shewanella]QFU21228.1 FAD-dependent oxidoreductase [Shewanella sp. YLB-09]QPG56519.1 NAD(P)/FAD-dependent oxidoreductase [Shewanella eurypsychrophilus]